MQNTVELDCCASVALQDDVNLCLSAVKVSASLASDIRQMDGCGQFRPVRKSASSGSAGAIDRCQFFELGDRRAIDHLGYRGANGLCWSAESKQRTLAAKVFGFAETTDKGVSRRKTCEDIRVSEAWRCDWAVYRGERSECSDQPGKSLLFTQAAKLHKLVKMLWKSHSPPNCCR